MHALCHCYVEDCVLYTLRHSARVVWSHIIGTQRESVKVAAGRRVGSQSHTGYADIPGGQRVSLRGRRQRDGPIYVNRAQSRRSMKERDMSFFHPTEIVHSVMSAMTSEPLATFTAGLLILSCLVTVTTGRTCPSYCRDGVYVTARDCGATGYCCGTPETPVCCTDYYEELRLFPPNVSETANCSAVLAALKEAGDSAPAAFNHMFVFRVISVSAISMLVAAFL
ncbi:hypothetical protein LSAT2_008169 [Lamellibrachia satsuma]|nr:hypothetical protein LSAT2_008169 [Lamellibrachia satsuma]